MRHLSRSNLHPNAPIHRNSDTGYRRWCSPVLKDAPTIKINLGLGLTSLVSQVQTISAHWSDCWPSYSSKLLTATWSVWFIQIKQHLYVMEEDIAASHTSTDETRRSVYLFFLITKSFPVEMRRSQ